MMKTFDLPCIQKNILAHHQLRISWALFLIPVLHSIFRVLIDIGQNFFMFTGLDPFYTFIFMSGCTWLAWAIVFWDIPGNIKAVAILGTLMHFACFYKPFRVIGVCPDCVSPFYFISASMLFVFHALIALKSEHLMKIGSYFALSLATVKLSTEWQAVTLWCRAGAVEIPPFEIVAGTFICVIFAIDYLSHRLKLKTNNAGEIN